MNVIRFREVVECKLCGSDISLEDELHFALGEHTALCFACAVLRGGVYDDAQRQWFVLPETTGLDAATDVAPRRYRAACAVSKHLP